MLNRNGPTATRPTLSCELKIVNGDPVVIANIHHVRRCVLTTRHKRLGWLIVSGENGPYPCPSGEPRLIHANVNGTTVCSTPRPFPRSAYGRACSAVAEMPGVPTAEDELISRLGNR
jgi:hypothetical protein